MNNLTHRQIILFKWINTKKSCSTSELAERFSLSRETIRKDLIALEAIGLVARKSGIVKLVQNTATKEIAESLGILTKKQRKERILEELQQNKGMRITSLAAKLRVSTITARKDVSILESEGLVIKKHGSVALFEKSIDNMDSNDPLAFPSYIKALGRHTNLHISLGETIFLNDGAVSQYVAASLPPFSNISIITNSISLLESLEKRNYSYPILITSNFLSLQNKRFILREGETLPDSLQVEKAFICCSSYKDHTYFLDEKEDVNTIEAICNKTDKIYIILQSNFIDIAGEQVFRHKKYISKIQEIIVDDGIGSFRVGNIFSPMDPIVICGQNSATRIVSKQKHRIGFLVNKDRNSFVQSVHNSILEATSMHKSLSLAVRECDGNYESTEENLNKLINDGVDIIIDYSLCMESLMYVSERCLMRNIKLISVDYLAPEAIYFGADNAKAGALAGKKAARFIKENWENSLDHLIVLGKYGNEPITRMRISSALEKIENQIPTSKIAIHSIEWGNPAINPTQALIKVLKEIPESSKLLILAFNVRLLLASYDLILQYRTDKNTVIVGQNHTKQIEELMNKDGSPILGCVHYKSENYGENIISLALQILNKIEVPTRNYTLLEWKEKHKGNEEN